MSRTRCIFIPPCTSNQFEIKLQLPCQMEQRSLLQSGVASRKERATSTRPILGYSSCARTAFRMLIGVSMTKTPRRGPLYTKEHRQLGIGRMDRSRTVGGLSAHIFKENHHRAQAQGRLRRLVRSIALDGEVAIATARGQLGANVEAMMALVAMRVVVPHLRTRPVTVLCLQLLFEVLHEITAAALFVFRAITCF